MNRKIMILSSDKTGHGHESIVQALKEQFLEQGDQADIRVVNGFRIGGPFGRFVEQLYFPMVQYFPCLWKLFFQFASQLPYAVNHITAKCIRKTFLKALREYHPDVIVSVHPAFVGSVNCLLERYGMNIPVIVLVADLVTISGLWADHRSSCLLAPTEEAKWGLMDFGVEEGKIRVFGFPVRSRFNLPGTDNKGIRPEADRNPALDILVFANAFNKSKTVNIIKNLLDSFDCTVTLLTGRDEKLKSYIQRKLPDKAGHKLFLPGYVVNMEQYMRANDLLITKAGPNIVMEAVHCSIPVIITGNLPGQEEGTTEWIAGQGLGTVSHTTGSLIETIRDLLDNDRFELNKIANNQMNYKNRNAAHEMAEYISGYTAKGHTYSEVSRMEELGIM